MASKKKNEKQIDKALAKEREAHHNDILKLAKAHAKEEKHAPENVFISLQNINKIYPNHVQAVYDFNLDIKPHEFIVFVGPSGCGKSTTLRMIAGLEDITYGDFYLDGEYANNLLPKDRQIGMVFQSYALYPHMTVYENMAFALAIKHVKKNIIDERVKKAASILQLDEYLNRKPNALSGGQCQRVALGRAIVADSKLLLMDEPLSNLDAKLRVSMRSEIVKIHEAMGKTTIYVTHDQTEAMTMATRIVVMSKGYVQQIGTPDEIFNHPSNIFVATFVGSPSMNLIEVKTNKNDIVFPDDFRLNMGGEFENKINNFYQRMVDKKEKQLFAWKDTLLNRMVDSKQYKKMVINGRVRKDYLSKFILNLNGNICNSLNINKQETLDKMVALNSSKLIIEELHKLLKEYLFLEAYDTNPEILKLRDTLDKLKAEQKRKDHNLILGIRPEHIVEAKNKDKETLEAKIDLCELLGSEYCLHFKFEDKEVVAKIPVISKVKNNDSVLLKFDKSKIHLFDPITTVGIYED